MKTFTQLIGTTATTSPSTYGGAFTTLASNNSANSVAIAKSLVNDQHRYLLQKYFDNERTVTFQTIGSETRTLTATIAIASTTAPTVVSATMTVAWPRITCQQFVNFSDGSQRYVQFTSGSASITWANPLTNTVLITTTITTVGVQDYNIPANCSKIKNDTITIGQIKFQPTFVSSRQEWDMITTLPYTSDIPNYCFIYNGKLSIFPIPSTTGNIITFNYKTRVPEMTFADYSTGNIDLAGMVVGSTSVTGLLTSWSTTGLYPTGIDISQYNLYLRGDPPYGDGIWYPILKFNSNTSLTLALPVVNAPNITAATTYTIGQIPLLHEDFHDMLVYGALKVYYSSIVDNAEKLKEFTGLYNERLELLKDYGGTKAVNVDLEAEPQQINPNLFIYSTT